MPELIALPLHQDQDGHTTAIPTAFVLRGFLSDEECQQYIALAEEGSRLEPCGYDPSIRQTDRYELKSDQLASLLFKRAQHYLQKSIVLDKQNCDWPKGIPLNAEPGEWIPTSMNQPLRICRYKPGGFFSPHHDEAVVKNDRERSLQTLMVYLNDDYEGGATNFYNSQQKLYCAGDPKHRIHSFQPQAGDALIFFGAITHDGGALRSGQKFILRTEIMYKRVLTEADWKGDACKPDHDEEFDFNPDEDGGFDYSSDEDESDY